MSFLGRIVMLIFAASLGILVINNLGSLDVIINSLARVTNNEFRILSGRPTA